MGTGGTAARDRAFEILDGLLQVTQLFMNISYFLIALGLLNLVL